MPFDGGVPPRPRTPSPPGSAVAWAVQVAGVLILLGIGFACWAVHSSLAVQAMFRVIES
jgi:hypothetical protein